MRCGFDEPPVSEASHGQGSGGRHEAPAGEEVAAQRPARPVNKTQRWLEGMRDVAQAASQLTANTRVISVMDREADVFELFDEQRRVGGVDVLVRAKHDRRLEPGAPKLFATLRNAPADGHVEVEIDRVTERRKSSRKQARPARSARLARAEVHYRTLTLPPPSTGASRWWSRGSTCEKPHRLKARRRWSGSC